MDYAELDEAFFQTQNEKYYDNIINDKCLPPTGEIASETEEIEHFNGGESSTGVKFSNGQVVRNNITTDKMERFYDGSGACQCKFNTYLLYLVLVLLLFVLYKK